MPSKRELCQNWRLYVITDAQAVWPRSLAEVVSGAIDGGADVIQLRDKHAADDELIQIAGDLIPITRSRGIPFIVNDRIRVARITGADGVHLGQEDGPLSAARVFLGEGAIIGRSTHSQKQALEAEKEGFDYIGVGPVFATPTKPGVLPVGLELVRFASQSVRVPFVAIGGIDETNVGQVRLAGAQAVAVVRAVMQAKDPKATTRSLRGGA